MKPPPGVGQTVDPVVRPSPLETPALFTVSPRRVRAFLLGITAILLVIHLGFVFARYSFELPFDWVVAPTFHFDVEANVPTWFSVLLLLVSAALLFLIGARAGVEGLPYRFHWLALSAVFLFLSADEMIQIHERPGPAVRDALGTTGYFYSAWVLVAIPIVAVLALVFFRFIRHFDPKRRRGLFLAAALYLTGAIGMEIVGSGWAYTHGLTNLTYELMTTVEELLEMTGVIVFIHTLLSHMADIGREWRIEIGH